MQGCLKGFISGCGSIKFIYLLKYSLSAKKLQNSYATKILCNIIYTITNYCFGLVERTPCLGGLPNLFGLDEYIPVG